MRGKARVKEVTDKKERPRPEWPGPPLTAYLAKLVVSRYKRAKPVSDDSSHLLDTREIRELSVLFLLVIDLIAIDEHLQNAGDAGRQPDRKVLAAFREELGGHPGRRAEMRSRHAVDDLDFKLSFVGHSYPPGAVSPTNLCSL